MPAAPRVLAVIILTLLWHLQPAQGQSHNNLWLRATVTVKATEKIYADNEWQHRRQNTYNSTACWDHNLMWSYRSWLHYNYSPQLRLSLSPFACFSNYKIIEEPRDAYAAATSETRFSAAIEARPRLHKKLEVLSRTALEYRIQPQQSNILRARQRTGMVYTFPASKARLLLYDELFVNTDPHDRQHYFDQNRTALQVEYKVWPYLKVELAYIYLWRMPAGTSVPIQENNILLHFSYQIRKHGQM